MAEEPQYNPQTLADQLDALLESGGQQAPGAVDDVLVETALRLANAPRPAMSAETLARLESAVLQARPHPLWRHYWTRPLWHWLAVAAGLVVVAIIASVAVMGNSIADPTPESENVTQETATPEADASPTSRPAETAEAASQTEDVTLVVEGPVEAIEGHIVTIFGIALELDADEALIEAIQIGDVLRIEGQTIAGSDSAITVVTNVKIEAVDDNSITGAEVYINTEGQVYRDTGTDCNNPPPDWAPARGWRTRCGGTGGAPNPGNSQGNGNPGNSPGQSGGPNENSGRGNINGSGQGRGN